MINRIALIILDSLFALSIIGRKINAKMLAFAEMEVSKISKLIVNKAVSNSVVEGMDVEKLFIIEKNSDGVLFNWLIPNAQKNMMEPVLVELAPGIETTGDIPHEGEEFGYVLEGKIVIVLGNQHHTCKKGEAFYYAASKPHLIINKSKGKARFLWISTPPSF